MQTIAKKKFGFVVIQVLLITFVVGNAIAWLSGAKPINFPRLPYSSADKTVVEQMESIPIGNISSEYAQSLGMLYFLHNHIDKAYQVLHSALGKDKHNPSLEALNAANDVKRAGERLDLLFGQVKLYELKQALHTLKTVSDAVPEQLDVQILALWAFVAVPGINDSAKNAAVIARRLEPMLNTEQSIPKTLAASSWLAMTKLYLYMADSKDSNVPTMAWQRQAMNAWQHYRLLKTQPIWLQSESDIVAQSVAGLTNAKV